MATAYDPISALPLDEQPEEPAFNESELVTILDREYQAADNEYQELRKAVRLAWDYYEGLPFGNEVDGRSQIILPDVQETVDYMTASVLRTFVSGDRVVEFEATDEEGEPFADEATAAIGFNFMRQQDGYRILLDWCTSGLMDRIGIAKTMMETSEKVTRTPVVISDPVELEQYPEADIESVSENEDGTWTVNLKQVRREKRSVDVAVPLSEFRFTPTARHEDDADYLAHCPIKTRSELVDMGFDREQVESLPAHTEIPDETRDYEFWRDPESSPALERIQYYEEYARIDIDGDGIAERVKVCRAGSGSSGEILRWAVPYANGGELAIETIEEQPFSVFSPFPRPHRLVGWSLADKVLDIQLARSTVARQLFDGMYNANMPRPVVSEAGASDNTIDDLLSPVPGSPIRVRDLNAVAPYTTNFDVGKSMQVVEWMSREGQARTGAVRSSQVLDPNTLNDQSATEYAGNRDDAQVRQEFIARNLGEAVSRLFAKKYRMLRNEGEPFRIKVDGKYKIVDPGKWPDDMNVIIRVGLGTGSKEKRVQARMAIAPFLAEGFQNKQVTPKHLFKAIDGLVRDLGLGQGDDFWKDPDAPPEIDPQTGQPVQEQEEPSPEVMAAQAKIEQEQQKLQLETMKSEAQLNLSREESAAKIELMREEGAQKLELEREKARYEAEANQERMQFEQVMAIRQQEFNERLAERKAEHDAAQAEAKVAANRPGGDLDK